MFEGIAPTSEEEFCNFLIIGGAGLFALAIGFLLTGIGAAVVAGISTTFLMVFPSTVKGVADLCKRNLSHIFP
jgi:hypothetical protein